MLILLPYIAELANTIEQKNPESRKGYCSLALLNNEMEDSEKAMSFFSKSI